MIRYKFPIKFANILIKIEKYKHNNKFYNIYIYI